MAQLNQPIPTQKFELIRNRIANILIDEITNQITLQYSDLFAMGVFIERFPNYDLTDLPVINVSLARGTFDNEDIRQQDGTYTFYVDAFMKFASVQNQDGSFTDGSSLAAIKVHRAIAFCRAVLTNQAYKTLGFAPPFLNSRTVSEFNIANPDREDMEHTIMARITVTVVAPETSELAEARLLDGYDTLVILGDTQLGYVFSGDGSPVPPPTCAPATYRVQYVNGTLIEDGTIASGGSKTINVPNPIVCEPATYEVLDNDGNVLHSGSIASGGNEQITILNSTININKSDGSLISSLSVLAQSTTGYNVADSTITNDPTSPTYTQAVKATENLVLPPQNILINTVNEGLINSVGDIEIVTNTPPSTIDVTGRTITMDFEFDVNLVDRFGNNLGTKKVSANANWDLRTLTPFDWADLYLNRLINPPSGVQEAAVFQFYQDMIDIGAYQKSAAIGLVIGGNADDHKWNSRYPFDKRSSGRLEFVGSPTHSSNGIITNGTTQTIRMMANTSELPLGNKQISVYLRGYTLSKTARIFGFNLGGNAGMFIRQNPSNAPFFEGDSESQFNISGSAVIRRLVSIRSLSNKSSIVIDGAIEASNNFRNKDYFGNMEVGGNGAAVDFCYCYMGEGLSDSQEADHALIVQNLQTALGRQI